MSRPVQGFIVIAIVLVFLWMLRQPTTQDKRDQKFKQQENEWIQKDKKRQHQYDSLQAEYEKLAIHYKNMKRSREVIKKENETLIYKYERLKNSKPVRYANDSQRDSVLAKLYPSRDSL